MVYVPAVVFNCFLIPAGNVSFWFNSFVLSVHLFLLLLLLIIDLCCPAAIVICWPGSLLHKSHSARYISLYIVGRHAPFFYTPLALNTKTSLRSLRSLLDLFLHLLTLELLQRQ